MAGEASIVETYKKWDRRFARAYKRENLSGPVNKGWRMKQFFADRTPEEAASDLARKRDTQS